MQTEYDELPDQEQDELDIEDYSEPQAQPPKKVKKPRKPLSEESKLIRLKNLQKANRIRKLQSLEKKHGKKLQQPAPVYPHQQHYIPNYNYPPPQHQDLRAIIREELGRASKPKAEAKPKVEAKPAPSERELLDKQLLSYLRY